MSYRITCIRKDDRQTPYERIQSVGGFDAQGLRFEFPQPEVVKLIDSGQAKFHVHVGNVRVPVITALSPFGNRYIKTVNDGQEPNNLLSLPECP